MHDLLAHIQNSWCASKTSPGSATPPSSKSTETFLGSQLSSNLVDYNLPGTANVQLKRLLPPLSYGGLSPMEGGATNYLILIFWAEILELPRASWILPCKTGKPDGVLWNLISRRKSQNDDEIVSLLVFLNQGVYAIHVKTLEDLICLMIQTV